MKTEWNLGWVGLVAGFLVMGSTAGEPLPPGRPSAEGVDPDRLARVNRLVRGEVEAGKVAGATVLVARHGRVVNFEAYGKRDVDSGAPMEKDTICRVYSMSKVVTAVAVLQLLEQNRLNLNSPVAEWLPEIKEPRVFVGGTVEAPRYEAARQPITVKMLLNHTSGFTYDFFSGSPAHEMYKKEDLWNSSSLDEFMKRVGRLPLLSQPGAVYVYGINDDILGALVQRVSGIAFEEYVARHITGPLRMVDTFFDVPQEKRSRVARLHELRDGRLRTTPEIIGAHAEAGRGIPEGGAGLFSTIGDYARFAQCLLNGGTLDGARILGRKTVELGRLNSLPEGVNAFQPADGWGLFSAVRVNVAAGGEPVSEGTFFWSGAATTHFFVDPKEDLVALVFCQHLPFDQHGLFTRFRTAVAQALE